MPSQKLCEPTSTQPPRAKRSSIARLGSVPCTRISSDAPSFVSSACSASAAERIARSVVVRTKVRPRSAAAQCAAARPTLSAWCASAGAAKRGGT